MPRRQSPSSPAIVGGEDQYGSWAAVINIARYKLDVGVAAIKLRFKYDGPQEELFLQEEAHPAFRVDLLGSVGDPGIGLSRRSSRVEQLPRKQLVVGSIPTVGSNF